MAPTRRPDSSTMPPAGASPATARTRVVLPAPLGPITETHSPSATSRSTPASRRAPATTTETPLHRSAPFIGPPPSAAAMNRRAATLVRSPPARSRCRDPATGAQQQDEERCPEGGGHHADRDLGRGQGLAGDDVGQHQ